MSTKIKPVFLFYEKGIEKFVVIKAKFWAWVLYNAMWMNDQVLGEASFTLTIDAYDVKDRFEFSSFEEAIRKQSDLYRDQSNSADQEEKDYFERKFHYSEHMVDSRHYHAHS